jgi:hypothetical protein
MFARSEFKYRRSLGRIFPDEGQYWDIPMSRQYWEYSNVKAILGIFLCQGTRADAPIWAKVQYQGSLRLSQQFHQISTAMQNAKLTGQGRPPHLILIGFCTYLFDHL